VRTTTFHLLRALAAAALALRLGANLVAAPADWKPALSRMPLEPGVRELNRTNCVPVMLQAFSDNDTVKALIFQPGATDELYFFKRVKAALDTAAPTLCDAVVALTNQTLIQAAWLPPFLVLHTSEDPLEVIALTNDPATTRAIESRRLNAAARFDDRDWEVMQAFLTNTLGLAVLPSGTAHESHHFFRHSFAACGLDGLELLQAAAMAGKTKYRVEPGQVVFSADPRMMTNPVPPENFLDDLREPPTLKRVGVVELENVKGRLGCMTADPAAGRLFVAAPENHSVEVIDIKTKKRLRQIAGLPEARSLACLPESGRLLVSCGDDRAVRCFDVRTWEESPAIDLGASAGNLHASAERRIVFAGAGVEIGPGAIAAIDCASADPLQTRLLTVMKLPSRPGEFQADPSGKRLYVNLPAAGQIAVLDTAGTNWALAATWPLAQAGENSPLALDFQNQRLFTASRAPARGQALDARTGALLFEFPSPGDPTGLFYDSRARRLYVLGGEGFAQAWLLPDNTTEALPVVRVLTAPGARSGLLIPELRTLAVAVPGDAKGPAKILLFETGD